MRLLAKWTTTHGATAELAYHDKNWRRDRAPLLDHLGAVIDHVEAFARGGAHDESNFVTACNKCNTRKSADAVEDFTKRSPATPVKGKYGEPLHWDGLSTVFVVMAQQKLADLTSSEREWLKALV